MNRTDQRHGLLRDSVMLEDDTTLLRYEILPSPNPLQASSPGAPVQATLTLAVSNPRHVTVNCTSITVTLAVGTNAKDLVTSADGITSQVPKGWSATQSEGTFTLQPKTPDDGQIGEHGLSFVFAGLGVNGEVGTTEVTIDEEASMDAQPPQERTGTLALPKFPTQFTLGDLTAEPLEVSAGDAATLDWSGSPATYRLKFDAGSGGQDVTVDNLGPYVANSLTRYPEVVFTLVVSYAVPGQDHPLVAQKQASVQVDPPPPVVTSFTGSAHGGKASFHWASKNAESCSMNALPLLLNPSGSYGPLVADRIRYTLVANSSRAGTSSAPSIVDLHASVTRQQPIPGQAYPARWLAATPDGSWLVAIIDATYQDGYATHVYLIDQASLDVTGSVRYTGAGSPFALSPDGTRLFLYPLHDDGPWWLTLLAIPSLAPLELRCPYVPFGAAFSPDGETLYVAALADGTYAVHVLDASLVEQRSFPVPYVGSCAVSADGARLYIVGKESLIVADTATGTILGQPPIGSARDGRIIVDAVRNRAYVSCVYDGSVGIVDLGDMTTLRQIPVGGQPLGIAMGPSGDEIYVASSASQSITVIDADALTVITTLPLPDNPMGVAFAPGPALKLYALTTEKWATSAVCVIEVTS